MSVSAVLDIALGLSFVFLLFSLAVSRINETIATALNLRHEGLKNAVAAMVGEGKGQDSNQLSAGNVLGHALIQPLQAAAKGFPRTSFLHKHGSARRGISYLPARTFSAAVLDVLAPAALPQPEQVLAGLTADGMSVPAQDALNAAKAQPDLAHVQALASVLSPGDDLAQVRALITQLSNPSLGNDPLARARAAISALNPDNPARTPLMRMLTDAQGDRDKFRQSIEHWFDDTMARVSGWYKRYVQRIILVISIVLVASLNVDSINIAQVLWRLPTERAAVASAAAAQAGSSGNAGQTADQQVQAISALKLPIGWTPAHITSAPSTDPRHVPIGLASWLIKVLGLILTVLALSLGAPFWFDALSKIASWRQSGPKPATSANT
jgi:hypothetical protein